MRVAEPYLVCESLSRLWPDQNMTEHGYRKWVTLKSLIRSEWLLRMAEYAPRMWVALQCLTRSEPLMWTNTHPGSEPLSCVWVNQNYWWEWLNMQRVSYSSVFEQIRTTDEHASSQWVTPAFEQIRTADKNGWTSRKWVSLQSLSW